MARSSKEFKALVEAKGGEARLVDFGELPCWGCDHRDPAGDWREPVPVRVEKMQEEAFDGTGYDGRGRRWQIWRLVPDESGMVPVDENKFSMLPEGERAVIGGGNSKTGSAVFFGRPQKDIQNDVFNVLDGLGL